ncbi:MAG: phage tail protein [Candidatus Limnocylindrus sp.]
MPQVFAAFFTAIGVTGTAAVIAGYIAYTVVTVALLRALAPKADMSQMRGLMTNTRGATDPQQIVYGTVRKGGTITYLEATGDTNEYLHMILVLAGHEVNAIGDIYINDEVATLDGSGFVTSQNWNSKIRIKKHLGTSTQAADADLLAESAQIDSNFRGRGIAYLYIRLQYDQDVFPNGIPLFSAVVQGKKVFDPRTSTTAYSANAALCIRDYLTDSRGLGDSNIDNTSFSAAANVCDENVPLNGGGEEDRYTINGVLNADMSIQDCLQQMVTACGGSLWWGGGSWKLKPGYYTAPVKTLTLDDIVSEINVQTRIAMRDNFNIVRGTFNDAGQRWIAAEYPEFYSAAFVAEDDGVQSPIDLELPLTTSSATAQRLAKQLLFRNREQMTFTADFGMAALELQVGDIIALTIDRYGWSAKEFEVVGWTFGANGEAGDLRVTMTLRETSSAAFSWSAEESEIIGNNSNLPDPFGGLTITGLTASGGGRLQGDGTFINSAILDWNDVSNIFIDYYEVEWRATVDSNYAATTTDESGIELSPLIDGIEYIFRVRAVTIAGVRGLWATVTFIGGGDTIAPGLPTDLSALGAFKYITVSWTNPADADFSHVEIYENTTNDSASATLAGVSAGTNFVRSGLGLTVTRYYWLKSVDFSGNKSAFTTGVSATTTWIDDGDFEGGINSLFVDQGLYAIKDVDGLPVSGTYDGEKVFNRIDGRLYEWTTSSTLREISVQESSTPIASILFTPLTGQYYLYTVSNTLYLYSGSSWVSQTFTSTSSLPTNPIVNREYKHTTTGKWYLGVASGWVPVVSDVGTIVASDKIVANTITGGLLAASGVITQSAQIGDALIENAKIKNLAVDTAKIANNAVTFPQFAEGLVNANLSISAGVETTIASITVTQSGAPAWLFAECVFTHSDGSVISPSLYAVARFKLKGNGQDIVTLNNAAVGNINTPSIILDRQITASGSVTYEFTCQPTGGTDVYVTIVGASIFFIELKK